MRLSYAMFAVINVLTLVMSLAGLVFMGYVYYVGIEQTPELVPPLILLSLSVFMPTVIGFAITLSTSIINLSLIKDFIMMNNGKTPPQQFRGP